MAFNNELSLLQESQNLGCSRGGDGVTSMIIDPFSHCLVYGRTLVHDFHQTDGPRPQPAPSHLGNYFVSQKFSFLPSDLVVHPSGAVEFDSYINNLHPRHSSLYRGLENLLRACLPLFSNVLTDLHRNNPLPQRIKGACRYTEWDEPEPPEHSDDEEGWATYERDVRSWIMHRPILLPDVPPNGYPGGIENRKYNVDLRGRKLQVVVNVFETRLVSTLFWRKLHTFNSS